MKPIKVTTFRGPQESNSEKHDRSAEGICMKCRHDAACRVNPGSPEPIWYCTCFESDTES